MIKNRACLPPVKYDTPQLLKWQHIKQRNSTSHGFGETYQADCFHANLFQGVNSTLLFKNIEEKGIKLSESHKEEETLGKYETPTTYRKNRKKLRKKEKEPQTQCMYKKSTET